MENIREYAVFEMDLAGTMTLWNAGAEKRSAPAFQYTTCPAVSTWIKAESFTFSIRSRSRCSLSRNPS
jgi:hypothetical protein